ncbi:MAG: YihY family inner membrane protein [Calditrichaeota bacterium]|nr:YihY family inner membrane protein [Calditrichota bacterium]
MNLNELALLIYQFFKRNLWTTNIDEMSRFRRFLFKQLRILVLAIRGFMSDKCPLHASALTYYSMLSLVPVAALAFGISKGFGMQETLKQKLLEELPEHKDVVEWIVTFADSLLQVSRSGLIAGIGIVLLIWAAIRVLGNIEESLNNIWSVKRGRSFIRKFSDYLSIMIIGPIIFLVSSSVAVFIRTQVTDLAQQVDVLNVMDPVIIFLLRLIPYTLIWLLFTLTYMIIPNTRVKFKAAVYGAVVAGTLYQFVQVLYIGFQIGAAKYSAIYGSFAALPLFLIWVQLSWFIVLFGAELSYAFQNVPAYIFEKESGKISGFYKKVLALNIAHVIIKNFENGDKPLTTKQVSKESEIPENITREIITDLKDAGIFSKVTKGKRGFAFQPASDISQLTIQDVLLALENQGGDNTQFSGSDLRTELAIRLQKFDALLKTDSHNVLLKDINPEKAG